MPPSPTCPDERDLVQRLRRGEERAFAYLLERHHGSLVRIARCHLRSDALAEEVAQDTWAALLTQIDRFEERCSLRTWIFPIALNRARTEARRETRTIPLSSLERRGDASLPALRRLVEAHWYGPSRPWSDPARRLESLEFRASIREALEQLPERQRLVVALRDVEGLSSAEVCELLEVTEENQRVLLHRGRARLRAKLAHSRELPAAA